MLAQVQGNRPPSGRKSGNYYEKKSVHTGNATDPAISLLGSYFKEIMKGVTKFPF